MAALDKRAAMIGGGALAAAVVLGVVGYLTGVQLAAWKASLAGFEQIVFASSREPGAIALATALMFAWPAVVGGVAATVHHIRLGPPSRRLLAVVFLVPAGALAAITMGTVMTWKSAGVDREMMIDLASLGPGAEEAKVAAFVAAVIMLYVVVKRPS